MTVIDVVSVLRKSWKLILGALLAGLLLAIIVSALQPRVYNATSSGYLVAASDPSAVATTGDAENTVAAQRAQQYLPLAETQAVADRLAGHLANDPSGASPTPIEATIVPQSNILEISATGPTPEQAQAVANAGVRAMADEIQRLETLNPNLAVVDESGTLSDIPTDGTSSIALVPFEPAALPSTPESPNLPRNIVLGLAAGLLTGIALAVLRRLLDLRARTSQDVEEITESSVLAVVPATSELQEQRKGGKGMARMGLASEALRQLRTNLRFVSVDKPPRSIVVTSANPGEGKSTVASNLARVLAEAGQPTILIDADLRRPMQAKAFDLDNSIGLTQVLAGDVRAEDALQATETPLLQLMPSGRIPANPSELVGSRNMAQTIDRLTTHHMVIIDAPPILPVTDAGLLSAASDGTILVVRVGKTYKEQVRLSAKNLQQVDGKLLGIVMNLAPRQSMGEVMYGYGKGYGYRSSYAYYGEQEKKGLFRRKQQRTLERSPVPQVESTVEPVDGSAVEDHSFEGPGPHAPGPSGPGAGYAAAGHRTGMTQLGSSQPATGTAQPASAPSASRPASAPSASRPAPTGQPQHQPSASAARAEASEAAAATWARQRQMDQDATSEQPVVRMPPRTGNAPD